MTDTVTITDVKKSWKQKLPSKKSALKWGSIAVFGTAVLLVAYDKLGNHTSSDLDTEETDTES